LDGLGGVVVGAFGVVARVLGGVVWVFVSVVSFLEVVAYLDLTVDSRCRCAMRCESLVGRDEAVVVVVVVEVVEVAFFLIVLFLVNKASFCDSRVGMREVVRLEDSSLSVDVVVEVVVAAFVFANCVENSLNVWAKVSWRNFVRLCEFRTSEGTIPSTISSGDTPEDS
jgi:hypothetical protein